MNGNLIPMTNEQAKLGQELVQALRGLGSFFEKALGNTPENLVGYLFGDRLAVRRAENFIRLLEETKRRLDERGVAIVKPATLSIALPILRDAADEDREELVDLWARLLANAMGPGASSVRYIFIEAVKAMDPMDARVLQFIHERKIERIWRDHTEGPQDLTVRTLASRIDCRPDDVEVSLRHLTSLGFFDQHQFGNSDWALNATSREFLQACYP